MNNYKKSVLTLLGALSISLSAESVMAEYPERPITVIVPYGAGGDSDLTTRIWADAAEKELGVPVVVINKAGGGGIVGTATAAVAKKDGYTLVNAGLSTMLVSPNFSTTPYNFDSFDPVVKMTSLPFGLVVSKDSPYQSFDDFIVAAKEKKMTMGSWGASSSGTVLATIIADQAGFAPKFVNAPSTAASMTSVVGGHIDSAISLPPAFGPHVKADRATILVMNQKMDAFPSVPTFADYGIKGSFEGWSGIFAPKGVPEEVIEKLTAVTAKVMKDPKVIQSYNNIGAIVDFRHGEDWITDLKLTYSMMKDTAEKAKK
ncbi:tripartite tricarboxylate transporter substrate binding protein [Amphritea sp. 1_MG-2023]|uniref:Bug family tripartite tricarboxylate transporter substrate binding protein n=1 Tax=Amphritea sp. 1_MG-2023 TaxID=3062670 RepID=UPI0026E3454A|nr:tripartite tricarboxylate transporter substrate binding protein [Amphritea sp. 1_MG-2023]MDO6565388.1 tripartite tricarboxylate transporter substrate binding protein [Amphritea sp. 1_MG-2023]